VVEHVPDPDAFVAACARLVAPGGSLVLSTMNRTPKAWLLAVLGAEHLGRLLPVGTHDWAKFRTPAEMTRAVETRNGSGSRSGMHVKDVQGIVFLPQNLKPLSSPHAWGLDPCDLDVNYIMYALRPKEVA
jgi:2-polyprenyl-6-hydroxyphenyl methylase/3-demethylubiquinone-9 3-methyltransferase